MKKLQISQMENLQGGNPKEAFTCGFGLTVGIGLASVTGGLSLVGLFFCI